MRMLSRKILNPRFACGTTQIPLSKSVFHLIRRVYEILDAWKILGRRRVNLLDIVNNHWNWKSLKDNEPQNAGLKLRFNLGQIQKTFGLPTVHSLSCNETKTHT